MCALRSKSMGSVASCMRAAPLLREVEIRNWVFLEPGDIAVDGPGPRIKSLFLDNHLALEVIQSAMDPRTLIPFSLRHLKKLSIHLPAPYDGVIIEDLVYGSEGPLEELTLLAPDENFGVTRAVARFEKAWRVHMPSVPVLPSRIPLRVLRFQMVDYLYEHAVSTTDPRQILMWLTRLLAKETGTISLERITIEVILGNPMSVYLCLNNEVWRKWDKVLSRSNVPSLNSVQVTLRALFDSPDLSPPSKRRMEDLGKHIIHCMPTLDSKGVLRVALSFIG
ncbi:hypothetical protein BDZ89DRAFT_1078671 [Hymenopellis radicata]|nr:hypothetical protein BDZ89DRAFT_1078671 [Hymenopellis radicata]